MSEPHEDDVTYARNFVRELAPTMLRLVAGVSGFVAPSSTSFDYCELGCGNGDTIGALAASNPDARFVGVDFQKSHVAFATDLATRAQLHNVRYLERDFAKLLDEDLPDFDFVALHGVYTWVSAGTRAAIRRFVQAKLRPGGLLYVGYNAQPGWSAIEPLRRLMIDRARHAQGSPLQRAKEALEWATRLSSNGAHYFASHPTAQAMLAQMQRAGLPYVVHEYLTADWRPMYFADLAAELDDCDAHFVGQAPIRLNFRDLAIPPALQPMARTITNRFELEAFKDFALNQFFRADVFVKGKVGRADATRDLYLATTPFGAIDPDVQLDVTRILPLLLEEKIWPLRTPMSPRTSAASYRLPLLYNRVILEQRMTTSTPIVLASPALGSGLTVPLLDAISLRLLTEVDHPSERQAWIRRHVARPGVRLVMKERVVDDADELVRVLLQEVDRFAERWAPKLVELGVLEPTR